MTDRKDHWEQVYQTKSPLEVSWYQQRPALSLELIARSGMTTDAAIIDIGGGASTLVDSLLDDHYSDVTVLDISSNALGYARKRLGQRANAVNWIVTDITSFVSPRKFSLWHDRAVFHFLTNKADRQAYVAALKSSLTPVGHVIIAAFGIGGPLKCSNLDIVQYDASKLCAELGPEFELVEEAAEMHETPGGRQQKFGYYRFIYRQK